VLGLPPAEFLHESNRRDTYFDPSGRLKLGKPRDKDKEHHHGGADGFSSKIAGSRSIRELFKARTTEIDDMFEDFMARTLTWNPASRLTPQQALQHPFLANL
jgi:dual specificity tyrosine-phosphorylation-regulated kinase 2/3/4